MSKEQENKTTASGSGANVLKLEGGAYVDLNNTAEPPEMFTEEQAKYLVSLTGHSILCDLKGQLLNIVEGIGLPERQETAVKRMVTNALHDWHRGFKDDIELVLKKDYCMFRNNTDRIMTVKCNDCGKESKIAPGADSPRCCGKYPTKLA